MKMIHEDCDPILAEDKSLPYTAYLVEYKIDEVSHYDIVMSHKRVEIFDHYWDRYRNNFITMIQSEGRVNPKVWESQTPKNKNRK
ncbi:MAG: hypothetical protein ACO370_09945, partial [Ilumatobacteraceae bacterium]